MGKENFISLSQANILNLCEGRLRVNLPLPYGLDERIEIDTHKMDVLRQMAGFSRVILTRDNESGTSQVVPQIDGINMDGTATSRRAKIKFVPEAKPEFKSDKEVIVNRANWPELKIKLNVEEIQQRMLEKREDSILNEKMWVKKLDLICKNSITKSGVKHLLSMKNGFYDNYMLFYFYGINLRIPILETTPLNIAISLFGKFGVDGIDSLFYGLEKKDKGYRMSFTLGPEIDRAIGLSIYSRIGSVIRAKTEEKK